MGDKVSASNVLGMLESVNLPPEMNKEEVERAIEEIAERARRRVLMAECGPFPAPSLKERRPFWRWLQR